MSIFYCLKMYWLTILILLAIKKLFLDDFINPIEQKINDNEFVSDRMKLFETN